MSECETQADGDEAAAAIATILRGMPIGRPGAISCSHCRRDLTAGQAVTAYCYRPSGDGWSVAGIACGSCHEPAQLEAPTLGLHEAVVEATIATRSVQHRQQHRLVLCEIDVQDSASPSED